MKIAIKPGDKHFARLYTIFIDQLLLAKESLDLSFLFSDGFAEVIYKRAAAEKWCTTPKEWFELGGQVENFINLAPKALAETMDQYNKK